MKFDKGTIKNINKKILAGALSLALVTSGLVGCSTTELNSFEYTTDEQGQYVVSGTIDYECLSSRYFLVIDNPDYNTVEYYIGSKGGIYSRWTGNSYYYNNILNNKRVFSEESLKQEKNRKLLVCEQLDDYLYATGNIKASYTVEDVEQILEELKTGYEKENSKQLVKGK